MTTKTELFYQAGLVKLATFTVGGLLKVLPKKQTLRDMSYLVTKRADMDNLWCSVVGPTEAPGGPRAGDVVMLVDKDQQGNGPLRSVVLFKSSFFLMPPHLLEKI